VFKSSTPITTYQENTLGLVNGLGIALFALGFCFVIYGLIRVFKRPPRQRELIQSVGRSRERLDNVTFLHGREPAPKRRKRFERDILRQPKSLGDHHESWPISDPPGRIPPPSRS
jgi:hypothetical protein